MTHPRNVVVIGGGTGSFAVLRGLKDRVENLTALVSMADDGGSTGTLRDELGVLPPGDVRQCLVALSDASDELRNLFNYRFENGGLQGHSFGNLFLSAVEKMAGDFAGAVKLAGDVLRIKGRVLPITLDNVRLSATRSDGSVVQGQHHMDEMQLTLDGIPPRLQLEPAAAINPEADDAIRGADLIVIAPGDIYTSLGPLLIVDGVAAALRASNARVAYVCNLVTKPGHTDGFTVADHAAEIERFAGGPVLDYVLYNTAKPDSALFERYRREGELPVYAHKQALANVHYRADGKPVLAPDMITPHPNDTIANVRSFIRHDGSAVADALCNL
jgi:uncharacterized cofD-like protein